MKIDVTGYKTPSLIQIYGKQKLIFKYEFNDTCCIKFSRFASSWRHQMETFSALLALRAGNSPVTGEFPSQRQVTRSFDVFSDQRLNKWPSKQSRRRWFETPSRTLRHHCNVSEISNIIGMQGKGLLVLFNIKSPSRQRRDFHYKDNHVVIITIIPILWKTLYMLKRGPVLQLVSGFVNISLKQKMSSAVFLLPWIFDVIADKTTTVLYAIKLG